MLFKQIVRLRFRREQTRILHLSSAMLSVKYQYNVYKVEMIPLVKVKCSLQLMYLTAERQNVLHQIYFRWVHIDKYEWTLLSMYNPSEKQNGLSDVFLFNCSLLKLH